MALNRYDMPCGADADLHAPVPLCEKHLHEVCKYVLRLGHEVLEATTPEYPDLRPPKESVIYYARIGSSVKIGWSTVLRDRMAAINPEELMATEPGGRALEKQRHSEFRDLRTHDEWFRLDPPLVAHIEAIKSRVANRG